LLTVMKEQNVLPAHADRISSRVVDDSR
jgi:hypothetical protein